MIPGRERGKMRKRNSVFRRCTALVLALMMVFVVLPMASAATYKQGSSGEKVRDIQENLIGLGYLEDDADGDFGPRTTEAVKAFQADFGLAVDGSAGKATQTALRNAVVRVQVELKKLGYDPGGADGHFGPRTASAVKAFQKKLGLKQTGTADAATRKAIDDRSGGMQSGTAIPRGSSGTQVKYLQQALTGLGFSAGTVDGHYGSMTEAAVREFQDAYGLTVDGKAGRLTMTALKNTVVALQSDLARKGYESGTINGVYGNGTKSAVKSYQKYHGFTVSGVAGPTTMRNLYGYSMGGSDTAGETYKVWIDPLYQDTDTSTFTYYNKGKKTTTIRKSGCAGVALAMVVNALKETDRYNSRDVMQWMADNSYYWGEGTKQSGLRYYSRSQGLSADYCDSASQLISHLKQGHLAIALVKDKTGEETFVKSASRGHYIVVSGYRQSNGADQVFINNPLSYKSSRWFDIDELMANCINENEYYANSFVVIYK